MLIQTAGVIVTIRGTVQRVLAVTPNLSIGFDRRIPIRVLSFGLVDPLRGTEAIRHLLDLLNHPPLPKLTSGMVGTEKALVENPTC